MVEIFHLFGQLDASSGELDQMVGCLLDEFVSSSGVTDKFGELLHLPIGHLMQPSSNDEKPWGCLKLKTSFAVTVTDAIKASYATLCNGKYVRRTVTNLSRFTQQAKKNLTDCRSHADFPIVDGKCLVSTKFQNLHKLS